MRLSVGPLCAALALAAPAGGAAQTTERQYLSGTDKDHTVRWDFMVTGGRRSGAWSTIPVPSNWELHGFGTYKYGGPPPRPTEEGRYGRSFEVPGAWRGKRVFLVFEGSMTDTEAWIDSRSVGPKHQGGFYEFRYDVTPLLRFGRSQRLEVTVAKESSDHSVNEAERHADFWIFGGLYRPVYLEAFPPEFVERVAVDARHHGAFRMDVHLRHVAGEGLVKAQIETLEGRPVGAPFSVPVAAGQERATLETRVEGPRAWTAESPDLYRNAAMILYWGRRFDEAIVEARKTLEMDPHFPQARRTVAKALVEKGQYQETIAEFRQSIASGGTRLLNAELGHAYARSGQRDEARRILQELTQQSRQRHVSPYDMAILHVGLGETEEAFAWLEKSHAQRERWMLQLKVAPFLDPLRSDPRFADLMRRVGVWS